MVTMERLSDLVFILICEGYETRAHGYRRRLMCLEQWDCVSRCLMIPAMFLGFCGVREIGGGREALARGEQSGPAKWGVGGT